MSARRKTWDSSPQKKQTRPPRFFLGKLRRGAARMCEAWVTRDPVLTAGAAAVLVCVTVLAYSGVLLTAIAGLVLYKTAGTRGTSRSARASA